MTLRRVQILVPTGGGGGGEVDRERLIREGLEPVPVPMDLITVQPRILQDETLPTVEEDAIVAAALIANETPIVPVDTMMFQTSTPEEVIMPFDSVAIQSKIEEAIPILDDVASFYTTLPIEEIPNVPLDATALLVGRTESIIVPLDSIAIRAGIQEVAPNPGDVVSLYFTVPITETPTTPIENVNLFVSNQIFENHPTPSDAVTALMIVPPELIPSPVEIATPWVRGEPSANSVVLSTGMTNPTNVLDKDTDEATATATSTTAGTVSTTLNVDFIVDFPDMSTLLGDLNILTTGTSIRWRIETGGVPVGGSHNLVHAYRLANSGPWTTIRTKTAVFAAVVEGWDTTSAVNGSWALLDAFQVRVSGSLVSGTGVNAARTLGISYFTLQVTAERAY